MFCTNCGKEIEDGAAFCVHCGTRTDEKGGKGKGRTNKAVIAAVAVLLVAVALFFVIKGLSAQAHPVCRKMILLSAVR